MARLWLLCAVLVAGCGGGGGFDGGSVRGVLLCGDDGSYLTVGHSRIWLAKVKTDATWATVVLVDRPPSLAVGPTGRMPDGTMVAAWVSDGPGAVARHPETQRDYDGDDATTWDVVPYCGARPRWTVRVHARDAWRWAEVEIEW